MSKLFDFKLIFIAIFLFLTIAVQNCENFQLRDLDGGSETKSVSSSKTKIRFPFRKLEKARNDDSEEDDDDDDEGDEVGVERFIKYQKNE